MTLHSRIVADVHVLTPHHNLVGGKETHELLAAVDAIAAKGKPHIVIDLGEIESLSSLGIAALVKFHTTCVTREGYMRLARISRRIHDVFKITRLVMVFETYDSIEEAVVGQIAHEDPDAPHEAKHHRLSRHGAHVEADTAIKPAPGAVAQGRRHS